MKRPGTNNKVDNQLEGFEIIFVIHNLLENMGLTFLWLAIAAGQSLINRELMTSGFDHISRA
jgi:hypothetical protein